jgi:hypothetical protein
LGVVAFKFSPPDANLAGFFVFAPQSPPHITAMSQHAAHSGRQLNPVTYLFDLPRFTFAVLGDHDWP